VVVFDVAFMMQRGVLVMFHARVKGPLYRYSNFFLLCEGAADVHVNMVYCCLVKGTGPAAVYCTLYCSSPLVHSSSLKDCKLNLMLAFRGSCSDVYIKCKYTTSSFQYKILKSDIPL